MPSRTTSLPGTTGFASLGLAGAIVESVTALGYEETGRGRQDGFDRVFMRKRLAVE